MFGYAIIRLIIPFWKKVKSVTYGVIVFWTVCHHQSRHTKHNARLTGVVDTYIDNYKQAQLYIARVTEFHLKVMRKIMEVGCMQIDKK